MKREAIEVGSDRCAVRSSSTESRPCSTRTLWPKARTSLQGLLEAGISAAATAATEASSRRAGPSSGAATGRGCYAVLC